MDITEVDDILAVYDIINRAVADQAAKNWDNLDSTLPQMKVFYIVGSYGPLSVGKITEQLGVGLPTASHLITQLENEGLVERRTDPEDRRRTLVQLSKAGTERLHRLRYGDGVALRAWITRLNPYDRAALFIGMRALAAICSREPVPAEG